MFKSSPHPNQSAFIFLMFVLLIPFKSVLGYFRLQRVEVLDAEKWRAAMCSEKVLIVGSGPSLDRMPRRNFHNYKVIIYINHAAKLIIPNFDGEQFLFTTDVLPIRDLISDAPPALYEELCQHNRIIAPIFFEQMPLFTEESRAFFTVVKPDAVGLKFYKKAIRIFGKTVSIPYTFRLHPRQPTHANLDTFFASDGFASGIPIVESTSALSAILFSAKCGAGAVDLIGCDFSAGRTTIVANAGVESTGATFTGAADRFYDLQGYLEARGTTLRNLSWEV